ncbi:hypothetical protein EYR40_010309 [Pleurotus pulmonarius]|nr:hypothetical protein EYR40_010309 [Pleurotus pulmonarius]
MSQTTSVLGDLSQRAPRLAADLGSLKSFLEASQTLLSIIQTLTASEIQRDSKKIIALTEVARSTLRAAGIQLYSFSSCSPSRAPFKNTYFDLLRELSSHRYLLTDDSSLKGIFDDPVCSTGDTDWLQIARLNKLLLPLSGDFTIERNIVSAKRRCSVGSMATGHSFVMPPRLAYKGKYSAVEENAVDSSSNLMPPPDAFPPSRLRKETSRGGQMARGLFPLNITKARPRMYQIRAQTNDDSDSSSDSDEEQQEDDTAVNATPSLRPRPYRFGIFCTPNRSMHQQGEPYQRPDRVGRSRTVRPIRIE